MMEKNAKIYVAGHRGMVGSAIVRELQRQGYTNIITRTHRELDPDTDIKKIADTFEAFRRGEDVAEKGFAAVATTTDIEKENFVLTPGRYVGVADVEDDGEPFDEKVARLTSELSELFAKSAAQEAEIRKQLATIGIKL